MLSLHLQTDLTLRQFMFCLSSPIVSITSIQKWEHLLFCQKTHFLIVLYLGLPNVYKSSCFAASLQGETLTFLYSFLLNNVLLMSLQQGHLR